MSKEFDAANKLMKDTINASVGVDSFLGEAVLVNTDTRWVFADGALVLISPDGTRYSLAVANGGARRFRHFHHLR